MEDATRLRMHLYGPPVPRGPGGQKAAERPRPLIGPPSPSILEFLKTRRSEQNGVCAFQEERSSNGAVGSLVRSKHKG